MIKISLPKEDFFKHNLIFLVGSLCIAAFSYLYYPVIGHMVSVIVFGEVQAWISLFMEFGIVLTAFGYVITNIVHNHDDGPRKQLLLIEIERLALLISLGFFVVLSVLSFYLKDSLQFTSPLPFIALGALIVLNVPATFRTYFLQGEKQLLEVSIAGVVFAAGKLLISIILILIGFKLFGVVIGYILAQAANLYYVGYKTKGRLPSIRSSIPLKLSGVRFQSERKELKREALYGLFIFIVLTIVTIMYTSDSIIARRFFSAEEAGYFSGISSVARIVFFVTASVAGVLIASVKIKHSAAENKDIMRKSLLLIVLLGGLVTLFLSIFSEFSVGLLIGGKYVDYAYLLPGLAVSMLLCAMNNLALSYQIALRNSKALLSALAGIVALGLAVTINHGSLQGMVYNYMLANLVMFTVAMIQIFIKRS